MGKSFNVRVEPSREDPSKWGLFVNGIELGTAKLRCDADLAAKLLRNEMNKEIEECYQAARGSNDPQAFSKFGTRQLYWKGRSDAATSIRERKTLTTQTELCYDVNVESEKK